MTFERLNLYRARHTRTAIRNGGTDLAFNKILLDRRDDIGIVTLNRPERLNAIDYEMSMEITDAIAELNADRNIGGIVLTGAGRGFCSGVDVSRFEDSIRAADGETVAPPPRPFTWIEQVRDSKPIICAINGACIGAGLTRTLPCDIRIASTNATFSVRFAKVGLVPEIISTQILPHVIGLQMSADLMLSARTFGAEEALAMGLVLKVVEPDQLIDEAVRIGRTYSENGNAVVLEIKRLLYSNYMEASVDEALIKERAALARRRGSPEQREAVAAFREKRAPDFRKLYDEAETK